MIIVDTNVVSELMRSKPEKRVIDWLDGQPKSLVWTTAVTVLECRVGIARLPPGRRRETVSDVFASVLHDEFVGRVLSFGASDAEFTAILIAERYAQGKPMELRDSMIAGMAKARRARLATRSLRHFDEMGLDVVNPWEPAADLG